MNTGQDAQQIIQSIIGGTAVLLLAAIGKMFLGVRADLRRFMQEHTWLLATTLWTRDKVIQMMVKMDMPMVDDPPSDLPWKDKQKLWNSMSCSKRGPITLST